MLFPLFLKAIFYTKTLEQDEETKRIGDESNESRRKKVKVIQRKREHDALLCYQFDTDHELALEILETMEEIYRLKLLCHSWNFQPGVGISENIENAVINSNHAIIILSTGFLESEYCKQELEMCLMEHKNDPSFKVFFILAQPKDYFLTLCKSLVNAELLKKIKHESLNFDDPELWEKLFKKIGKGSNDDNDTDDAKSNDYLTLEYEKTNAHTPMFNVGFR